MIELVPPKVDLKEQKYSGFACPQAGLDESFLESLAIVHARKSVRSFLARYGASLELYGDGLLPALQEWLRQESSFLAVWDLSLGNILDGIRIVIKDPAVIMRRAAELALRMAGFGLTGCWQANLISPIRLRFGNYWLPLADHLEVETSYESIHLTLRNGFTVEHFEFRQMSGVWEPVEKQPEMFLFVKTGPDLIKLLPAPVFHPEEHEAYGMASDEATDAMQKNLQAGLEIIRDYSPIYLPWVERVIRAIVPGGTGQNVFFSGSVMSKPGIVNASINIRPVMLAELLVHEGTHQYMHLLSRFGPLDDGSDPTLYYSPVKKTGRPISAIALSYHAFANIILFYRLCQANGLADDGYCAYNEKVMLEQVAILEEPLHTSQALTPQGQALWEPLAWRLREV